MEKKIITQEEKNKIINLFKDGGSLRGIAKEFNYSQTFITNILNEFGIIGSGLQDINKRFDNSKFYVATCKKEGNIFEDFKNKSGVLTEHIKKCSPDFVLKSKFLRKEIERKTGFFWYEEFFLISERETFIKPEVLKCNLCEWETVDIGNKSGALTKHLDEIHKTNISEYLTLYPDLSILFKTFIEKNIYDTETIKTDDSYIICEICNEKMRAITNSHVKKHGLSMKEYKRIYDKNTHSPATIEKLKNRIITYPVDVNRVNTEIELKLVRKLEELSITHIHQFENRGSIYDFFLNDYNLFIEADGEYWHGHDRDTEWHFSVFNNIINDYKKNLKVGDNNIIRLIENRAISEEKLQLVNSKDEFFNYIDKEKFVLKDHKIFNLKESDKIFSKEYCLKSNEFLTYGKSDKVINNILFLWNTFYNPELNKKFINLENREKEFRLKGIFFDAFYNAKKNKNKNLRETFLDKEFLIKVIKYRLGINKSQEFFDLNIKNLYRGIEVRSMFNVGIFPINQAKEIYNRFLNVKGVIYDPFSGWGSRAVSIQDEILDGFYQYKGYDINEKLENGYTFLKNNDFKNSNNIDLKIQDSSIFIEELVNSIDFIFTSPPFYNDEIYFDGFGFKDLDEWDKTLLIPVFQNCYLYLKQGSRMAIDIKESYKDNIIKCAENCGFIFDNEEEYEIKKTHFSKKESEKKKQLLLIFRKN